jgi:hypothetical protein
VARENGLVAQTLGNWVNTWQVEHAGAEPELRLSERARLKELEREVRELRMETNFWEQPRLLRKDVGGVIDAPRLRDALANWVHQSPEGQHWSDPGAWERDAMTD